MTGFHAGDNTLAGRSVALQDGGCHALFSFRESLAAWCVW